MDEERLGQLRTVYGDEGLADALRDCLTGIVERRDEIAAAIEAGDAAAIASAAHAAKGLAATFAAGTVAELFGEIDQRARDGDSLDRATLAELDDALDRTRRAFAELAV